MSCEYNTAVKELLNMGINYSEHEFDIRIRRDPVRGLFYDLLSHGEPVNSHRTYAGCVAAMKVARQKYERLNRTQGVRK